MKTKHTPGPWTVEVHHKNEPVRVWSHNRLICTPSNHAESGRLDTEDMANARLIAAAPELLEALLKCINELESQCESGGFTVSKQFCLSEATKAIAKATGGAE